MYLAKMAGIARGQFLKALVRKDLTVRLVSSGAQTDTEWKNAKPYSEIPGPKPIPFIKMGNAWRFAFGDFKNLTLEEINEKMLKDYGPISKLEGIGKDDIVLISDPKEVEKVFRNETIWPNRRGLECISYYRTNTRNDVYKGNPGVLSTQGEEWQKNRTQVNQPMMRPTNVRIYHDPIQNVAAELVDRIRVIRDDKLELPSDFLNELNKWSLESIALVALDARIGALTPAQQAAGTEAQRLIYAVDKMFSLSFRLDILPSMWRYMSTPDWREFVRSMDIITDTALKYINKKLEEIKSRPTEDNNGLSILETLLRNEGQQAAITMAIDMITAGIDTTSNTSAILLYYLSKDPEAQNKVFKETLQVLPAKTDSLATDYLNSMPYLKACFKESQRLTPIATGNQRSAGKDLVLRGYQIPKGTDVIMMNMQMCKMDEHFERPTEFIPERWLKSETGSLSAKNAHPFVFLPFGFGPRMCVGRRFAEMEIFSLVTKIIRNYEISYNYGEMKWASELLIKPADPLRFKMEDRLN